MSEVNTARQAIPVRGSKSKPMSVLANIVSYVFHPVFMPTAMAFVLYQLARHTSFAGIEPEIFYRWLAMIGLNTIFFPLFTVLLLKGLSFIESIHMHNPKDRIIPLIGCMIFYFWANHVFSNSDDVPLVLHTLTLGSFWGIIVLFLVNIFYKVSMHTAAAGGMLGIMLVLLFTCNVNMVIPFFVALFIAGLIGTARMILGAHKIWEVWLGYLLGIAVQVAAYLYLR